ncbi:Enamine deaminase RidA, house cleaning of reactive enamine intermediates, YjgF/YER057c/UK114 family [Noviherbaspirillum humi]|uniref:Enamine deaminase RidA, house cleaning of reactive enamine intermediates, YjgF/YER057c/UK114 family n=1 Tax=Noviherbaspirillum humi TaxID=1688639 RepID=A0A239I5J6_9BURK|nr:RidA family protein [Noviherbaspirillum humi]SNS88799.1 Enamine deaminase RidA, house cleaning of reactive enamine intermediates, YjgF/YER057c/UK114 family [Noviherbaspirillum humi]
MDLLPVRRVQSADVPEPPNATWSNCLVLGNEIAISGMTAHPASRDNRLGTYEQTLVVLNKVRALVEAAGGGLHNIYKIVVYVTDIADKDEVGRARREFFRTPYPCSTLVAVKDLVFPELTVEIDAFARLDIDMRAAQI